MQLSQSLFALVSLKLGPKLQMLIQDGKCLLIVLGQSDFLPQLLRQVSSFNSLHIEVAVALMLEYSGVAAVC